jgi:dTDP-4-amino-4,6-dideoxygalactose transaminase
MLQYHQLRVVGIDLPEEAVVAVDCDAIKAAITDKTVAILVVHVFGMITADTDDMKRIRDMAAMAKIDVLEDCAEAFSGIAVSSSSDCYMGSPYADLTLFSFGTIKTCTSLGGGIAIIRNYENKKNLFVPMARMHDSSLYDPQTNFEFLWKVCRAFFMNLVVTSPLLYGLVFACLRAIGLDFDHVVTSFLRGFVIESSGYMRQIRRKPAPALLALMQRRFCQSIPFAISVRDRVQKCQQLSKLLEEDKGAWDRVTTPTPEKAPNVSFGCILSLSTIQTMLCSIYAVTVTTQREERRSCAVYYKVTPLAH